MRPRLLPPLRAVRLLRTVLQRAAAGTGGFYVAPIVDGTRRRPARLFCLRLGFPFQERHALPLVFERVTEAAPAAVLALILRGRGRWGVYDGDVSGRDPVHTNVRGLGDRTLTGGSSREGCLDEITHAASRIVRNPEREELAERGILRLEECDVVVHRQASDRPIKEGFVEVGGNRARGVLSAWSAGRGALPTNLLITEANCCDGARHRVRKRLGAGFGAACVAGELTNAASTRTPSAARILSATLLLERMALHLVIDEAGWRDGRRPSTGAPLDRAETKARRQQPLCATVHPKD